MIFTNQYKQAIPYPIHMALQIPDNVITELNKPEFLEQIQNNRGLFFVKFGAEWCSPCKRIDPLVYSWFQRIQSDNVQCALLDIDDNFEVYALMKTKKIANGVPAIICYHKDNKNIVPTGVVIGANETEVNHFFEQSMKLLQ